MKKSISLVTQSIAVLSLLYPLAVAADALDIKAVKLAKKLLIVDTHIDVPYRLNKHYEDVSKATLEGDFDYPRAIRGGLNAPFMSIYIPAKLAASDEAINLANSLIDDVEKIVNQSPDKFMKACSTSDIELSQKLNKIALPMGMENGSPIAGNFENLAHFWKRGIRYITLAHSKSNHISDSSYDTNRQWNGLSHFGKLLIPKMNKLGIMIDVSHISDIAFYQVMEISQVPVIASHSSARHFTPDFERNMSDEMIVKLAKNNGVIQINFGSTFIIESAQIAWKDLKTAREQFIIDNEQITSLEAPEVKAFVEDYKSKHPELWASVENVLDHVDHVVKLSSINNVGLGSDYDGVGDSLPNGLKDVSTYPNLIKGLLMRGYDETAIKKILGGNLMRVWKSVEQYANEQGTMATNCATENQG